MACSKNPHFQNMVSYICLSLFLAILSVFAMPGAKSRQATGEVNQGFFCPYICTSRVSRIMYHGKGAGRARRIALCDHLTLSSACRKTAFVPRVRGDVVLPDELRQNNDLSNEAKRRVLSENKQVVSQVESTIQKCERQIKALGKAPARPSKNRGERIFRKFALGTRTALQHIASSLTKHVA